ncbi:sensor histidine kinase [Saccharibacillus alkalitolerans]|uniref:histidine kinase n=1 Tax=Saccharibacillus alkalitolerans TaxID=2705290 RepID=A0ABX0F6U9_9BACL|nr:sensor histidine kinase [Saccharibacillus alkalitolerans]NGZ74906.1 sensor histidine kinase [Saccharibacillus alkalitolerans]
MRNLPKMLAVLIGLLAVVFLGVEAYPKDKNETDAIEVGTWQFLWDPADNQTAAEAPPEYVLHSSDWTPMNEETMPPAKAASTDWAWIRIDVPQLGWPIPAVLIEKAYGRHVVAYTEYRELFDSRRQYRYAMNELLLPLRAEDAGGSVYIRMQVAEPRPGIVQNIAFGSFYELLTVYLTRDILDIMLGGSFALIGLVMLICAVFLNRNYSKAWLSLSCVILSIGLLVISYSPFLFTLYPDYGGILQRMFDVALFALLPSFLFFFQTVFGKGYRNSILHLSRFQLGYSFFCLLLLIGNVLTGERYFSVYYLLTTTVLGVLMIVELLTMLTCSVLYSLQRNKDALIFNAGLAAFAGIGIFELFRYYASGEQYDLYWWKWGMVIFVVSLIVVLGRRFAETHNQVLEYSRQLETFNNELQRAEKMEIISELAASVAHEVRNPLQVTRGFLQLLGERSAASEKAYIGMALEELDRASGIITDFLTFAKPGAENVKTLSIAEEFRHIEGVLTPLASIHHGKITLDIAPDLYVKGNSSKFKQAFINMIKNSIEALQEEGKIAVRAAKEDGEVVIRIRDNGVGMGPEELKRLGEPYFSNKTKGTGLGLMVTFRIIEAMQGTLTFDSEKGAGTEATVRFPEASD